MEHLHVEIYDYQYEYLEENNYIKSAVVRDELDAFMLEDGADPDEWEERHGQ